MWFVILSSGLALLSPSAGKVEAAQETVTLTILHTNDLLGNLDGAGRRASLIRGILAAGNAVALDAGNLLSPDPVSAHDRGATMVETMGMTGYAAAGVGARDLDFGPDTLRARASEAKFAFLSANVLEKSTGQVLLKPWVVFNVGGVQVGVIGVTPPELVALSAADPLKDVKVADPVAAAQSAVSAVRKLGVDYVILLTSMRGEDVLDLAQAAEPDLVVAGSPHRPVDVRIAAGMVWLMGGTRVVSTPKLGDYIGRVEVVFAQEGTRWRPRDVRWWALIADGAPSDPEVAGFVEARTAPIKQILTAPVGHIDAASWGDMGWILAGILRERGRGEIGVVNRGALDFEEEFHGGPLARMDIARMVRFNADLVSLDLRGSQLRALIQRSDGLRGRRAELFFAGVERSAGTGLTVNGRPLMDSEQYRLVTTDFLSEGGDGHGVFRSGGRRKPLDTTLRRSLADYLREHGTVSAKDFWRARAAGVWQGGWTITGSFVRNFINDAVSRYRAQGEQVAVLGGATSVAWSGKANATASYEVGREVVTLETRFDFGQVGRGFGDLVKSTDQIEFNSAYRYRTGAAVDPVVSAGFLTAFTKQQRIGGHPFQIRGSLGFQREVLAGLTFRLGGRGQRDIAANANDLGMETGMEYRRRLKTNVRYSGRVRGFLGLTDRRVIIFEDYNTLSIPLVGLLNLTVQGNLYAYRVTRIKGRPVGGTAFRTDFNVGLSYGVNWKYY